MTPAEMVESHPVVAHGYHAGAQENEISPGVTPEQTIFFFFFASIYFTWMAR